MGLHYDHISFKTNPVTENSITETVLYFHKNPLSIFLRMMNTNELLERLQQGYPQLEATRLKIDTWIKEFYKWREDSEKCTSVQGGPQRRGVTNTTEASSADYGIRLKNKINREYTYLYQTFNKLNDQFQAGKKCLGRKDAQLWNNRISRLQSEISMLGIVLEQMIDQFTKDKDPKDYLFAGYDPKNEGARQKAADNRNFIQSTSEMLSGFMDQGLASLHSISSQNNRIRLIKEKEDDMTASAQISRGLMNAIDHVLSSNRRLVIWGSVFCLVLFTTVYYFKHG